MNFPSITDNADSILALIGVSMLFYSITGFDQISEKRDKTREELYEFKDSLSKTEVKEGRLLGSVLEKTLRIQQETDIQSPIYVEEDSTIAIDYFMRFDSSQHYAKKAYYDVWDNYKKELSDVTLRVKYLGNAIDEIKEGRDNLDQDRFSKMTIMICGAIFTFLGIFGLRKRNLVRQLDSKYLERSKGPLLELCQSCGRSFNSIVKIGSYADGTPSYSLCQDCFKDGRFRYNDTEAWEMIKQEIQNMEWSEQDKKNEIEKTRKLERWSTKNPLGHKTI